MQDPGTEIRNCAEVLRSAMAHQQELLAEFIQTGATLGSVYMRLMYIASQIKDKEMATSKAVRAYKGQSLAKAVKTHEKAEIEHGKKQLKRDMALLADAKKAKGEKYDSKKEKHECSCEKGHASARRKSSTGSRGKTQSAKRIVKRGKV